MKSIEDIEKMTLSELERIADDDSVRVPSDLDGRIRAALTVDEFVRDSYSSSGKNPGLLRGALRAAVAVSVAASLAFFVLLPFWDRPEDTFDDPRLAYEQVEKAFELISSKIDRGLDIASQASTALDTVNETMNQIYD